MEAFPLRVSEDELRPIPSKGWAEMIRKVYEVDPFPCPQCGGQMKVSCRARGIRLKRRRQDSDQGQNVQCIFHLALPP